MLSTPASEYIQSLRRSERFGDQVAAYRMVAGTPGEKLDIPVCLPEVIARLLSAMGIDKLYSHQVDALTSIRNLRHTVVATPTASGKSLIYNLPVFEAVAADPEAKALYIFPLKALTQDQYHTFVQWSAAVPELSPSVAIYDGDTSAYQRRKIRSRPPNALMTNPEMVHLALLPHHTQWLSFLRHLKLVVVDEVHTYRGLLGSHFSQVLRRLHRVCTLYSTAPTFVFASATVANPNYLAGQLTGLEVNTITRSGAPSGARHMVLMNPVNGPAPTAIALLKAAMARELRTIVYTKSRKLAELITLWVQQQSGRFADKISVYRAGLLPSERRRIEQKLKTGDLLAVVSTSALELGIDIGDLDICILAGYPGSMIATWQRTGRVGRKGQTSALIMIAAQDALDQYFVANPKAFFEGQAESAVINPYNPVVLDAHLECAAAELPLTLTDPWLHIPQVLNSVLNLEKAGLLIRSENGDRLFARRKRPHLSVDLRSAGGRYAILDGRSPVGDIDAFRVYREAHPGAVYLHQGQTYQVMDIDENAKTIQVHPATVNYFTRVHTDADVRILEIYDSKNNGIIDIYYGKVKVTDHVIGYEKVMAANGRKLEYVELKVPETIYETDSVWFYLPSVICEQAIARGYDLLGGLHAAEHAAISTMPILVMADRNDVGGLATPYHPQVQGACIFIYDGLPGGAGFSLQAFRQAAQLVQRAIAVIDRCKCKAGCPGCVHSPKCGSGNKPMDKAGALFLLDQMIAKGKNLEISSAKEILPTPKPDIVDTRHLHEHYGVFDLETQLSAREVGGWHMAHRMKVSCGVVYDADDDTFSVYTEDRVGQLIEHLKQFDLVVGFNSKRFDYKVLGGYSNYDFKKMPSLDLLERVHNQLGFRLPLDHLAEQTLGIHKSGSGLDALRWWQEGQMNKIIDYCRLDVKITRDLYRFVLDNGYLLYRSHEGNRLRIPIAL